MSALFEDSSHSERFFSTLPRSSSTEAIHLRVLEWFSDDTGGYADFSVSSAEELFTRDTDANCNLRVIFAPSQPTPGSWGEQRAFQAIFQYYDVPSTLTSEYFTSPAYSFGKRQGLKDPEVDIAWTRFLCKDVLSHPGDRDERELKFHDNFLWIKCITLLHTRNREDKSRCVTMLCFGAPQAVRERFERLLKAHAWMDAVHEPYILFALVFEQCFFLLDKAAWTLATWFRPLERATLDRARTEVSGVDWRWSMDFAKLHEIAKHAIYLNEAATAAVLEMESVRSHLQDPSHRTDANPLIQAAISQLQYQSSAFRSTQLRLSSLDKRIANVISLSFNLVNQRDSRLLKHDSNAMKAIALLTLVFLPMTGIATLFSTPFFEVRNGQLVVAMSFWVFWVISVCLTLVVVAAWFWWYQKVKQQAAVVKK